MLTFYRNLLFVTILLLSYCGILTAQNSQNYSYSTAISASLSADKNGNIIDFITAGNLITNNVYNTNTPLSPVGFDFFFMGKPYSYFIAGCNGMIGLGLPNS